MSEENLNDSLLNYIEKKFQKEATILLEKTKDHVEEYHDPPSSILLEECLFLIYRFSHLEKLKKKNGVYETRTKTVQ